MPIVLCTACFHFVFKTVQSLIPPFACRYNSGRLDKMLYVPVPTPADRASILKAVSSKITIAPDVDLEAIGRSNRADGYSGADCAALLREAGLAVLKEGTLDIDSLAISKRHFDYAFDHVVPSVSVKDQARYNRMRDKIAHARSRGAVVAEPKEEEEEDQSLDKRDIDVSKTNLLGGETSEILKPSEEQPASATLPPASSNAEKENANGTPSPTPAGAVKV